MGRSRKMKLKKFSIIGLIVGALAILAGFGIPALTVMLSDLGGHSIGIIGGADGPTAIMITRRLFFGSFLGVLTSLGIPLVLISLFCLGFPSFVQRNFSIKTSALALGISATGAFGLCCFFTWLGAVMESVKKYPISYPASIAGGVLALVLFFTSIVLYCIVRTKKLKAAGILLDILTSVIYLPFFFFAEGLVIEWIRNTFHLFA